MADFDEVTRLLRLEHRASTSWMTGGYGWACSCGKSGTPGTGYPTEKQAQARLDRHLQGARRQITARLDNPPTIPLEQFGLAPTGRVIYRCMCGYEHCRGWVLEPADVPWLPRPWQAPVDFIGPLIAGPEWREAHA